MSARYRERDRIMDMDDRFPDEDRRAVAHVPVVQEMAERVSAMEMIAPPVVPVGVSNKVAARVAAVMAEAGWIEKRGHNKFHGYDYATVEDIRAHLAKLCGKHGLAWRQDELRAYPVGGKLIAVTYQFSLSSADEPDKECFVSRVTALAMLVTNKGSPDDKAFSKARSLAWKDWARAQFGIAAGDDPDPDAHEDDTPPERRPEPRPESKPEPGPQPVVPRASTPQEWADNFQDALLRCANVREVDELLTAERANLSMLEAEHEALFKKCMTARRLRVTDLEALS